MVESSRAHRRSRSMARGAGSTLFSLVSCALVACSGRLGAPPNEPAPQVTFDVPDLQPSEGPVLEEDPAPKRIELAAPPPGLVMDGSAGEWPPPASTSVRDRVWLAADARGLWLALDVPAPEREPAQPPTVTIRHPAAELPPVGFVNQFGLTEVTGEAWCDEGLDGVPTGGSPDETRAREACKGWYREQLARRIELLGAFETKIALSTAPSPSVAAVAQRAGERVVVEARIDLEALPALTTVAWRDLEIEIAVPGGVTHRFTAHLREPVRVVKPGTLLDRVLLGPGVVPGEVAAYYHPGRPETLHYLVNEAIGYQYAPEAPSPTEVTVDLSAKSLVAHIGDVAIEQLVLEPGFGWMGGEALVSSRGDQVLDLVHIGGGHVEGTASRGDEREILVVREGTASVLGTGACGACPTVEIASLVVSKDGRFTPLTSLVQVGGYGEDVVEHSVAADLSSILVRYNRTDFGDPPRTEGQEIRLAYDRRAERYRETRRTTKAFPDPS